MNNLTRRHKNRIYNGTTEMILDATDGTDGHYFRFIVPMHAILDRLNITPDNPDYVIYRMAAAMVIIERDYTSTAKP